MGIRDRAIEAQDIEEGRDKPKPSYPGNDPLLNNLNSGGHIGVSAEGYEDGSLFGKWQPLFMVIEMRIPIEEIGESADQTSESYNYNRMLDDAEQAAIERLEQFAGGDLLDRYEISFTITEDVGEVEVIVKVKLKKI